MKISLKRLKDCSLEPTLTKAMINNSAKVAECTKRKTQLAKALNQKSHRNALLYFIANKFLFRKVKQALYEFKSQCGFVTAEMRLQIVREVASLEHEIEGLKDQLEAKTYSAYNSNTNKGYSSLTGDLALVAHDDSKVRSSQ
jgi:uncharacterized protein Yka (UPF0111/DUF47 family)